MRSLTTPEFIYKARQIHGNRYGYDKVVYQSNKTPVVITCKIHGDFLQKPNSHLTKNGCGQCGRVLTISSVKLDKEAFLKRSKKCHGDFYNYEKTVYTHAVKKLTITCPLHGDFEQTAIHHMKGRGCPMCRNIKIGNKLRSNTEEFVKKSRRVHGDRYSYENVDYKSAVIKVQVNCPVNGHGEFEVSPNNHLQGRGCPKCKAPKGELAISDILKKNDVEFTHQYRIPEVSDVLTYDFYLPQQKLLIEFQGGQHFSFVPHFHGTTQSFHRQQLRDCKKQDLAKAWGYKLLVIHHQVFDNSDEKAFEEYLLSRINQCL